MSILSRTKQTPRWALWRAFWVLVLAMHLGPILSLAGVFGIAADEPDRLMRLATLLPSAAFFALKIADVRWLRLAPGWRGVVASSVIIALLHLGAIERAAATDALGPAGHVRVVLFAGGILGVEVLRQGLRRVRLTFAVPRQALAPRPLSMYYRLARIEALRPSQWWAKTLQLVPRPPPA